MVLDSLHARLVAEAEREGLLDVAYRAKWMTEAFRQIGVVTLPVLCFVVSGMTGASMFIAPFVAGLV